MAQGVAIGDSEFTADESAILDIQSSDKGLLIPKIALVDPNSSSPVNNPANGLMIYNTTSSSDLVEGFYIWNGSKWSKIITENSDDPRWNGEANKTSDIGRLGSVGIGTNDPIAKLSIREDGADIPCSIHKYSTLNGEYTGMFFKVYGSNYSTFHKGAVLFERSGSGGVGNIHFATTTSTVSTNIGISDARMTILADGKVGVGTQEPASKFCIRDETSTAPLSIYKNSSSIGDETGLIFKVYNNESENYFKGGIFFESESAYGVGCLKFATTSSLSSDNVSADSARLTITSDGKIGIGTDIPNSKLSIREDNDSTPLRIHRYSTSIGDYTGMLFKIYGSDNDFYHKGGIFFERTASSGRGNIHFATTSSTVSKNVCLNDSKMTLTYTGKLGIGTTAPTQTLDVNGTIRIRGGDPVEGGTLICDADGNAIWQKTKYEVGDFAQGGVVFWVDESGEHGLVCAIEDQNGGAGIQWYNGVATNTEAHGRGIFAGKMNTMLIVANQGSNSNAYAAGLCSNYYVEQNGIIYGDWYLPSKEELVLMYQNQLIIDNTAVANGGSTFSINLYWSSYETGNTIAYSHSMYSTYETYNNGKIDDNNVRAVRSF